MPVLPVGRQIDVTIERLLALIIFELGDRMALRDHVHCQSLEIRAAEQHGCLVVDRVVVRGEVQLGGVDRDPADLEAAHRRVDEIQPGLDRSEMLQRAGRPAEIEIVQIRGDGVHVDRAEGHRLVEALVRADGGAAERLEIAQMLSARVPVGRSRVVGRQIGRDDRAAARRQHCRQRFPADAEAQSARARLEHAVDREGL
jgi:hypothetical protein